MSPLETLLAEAHGGSVTARKAAVLIERFGGHVSGVVLTFPGGHRGIAENGCVRSLDNEEMQALMHPAHPEAVEEIKLGDYVHASKFSDCDPGDPWRIGYVCQIVHTWNPRGKPDVRYVVGEADGTWSGSFYQYRCAKKITQEEGIAYLAQHRA